MSTGHDAPARPTSFVTERPVAVFVITLATVVFGWFSAQKLPLALMPELSYPTLTVRTEYPGAAPEEVENDISRPLEEALGVIGGLRRVSSISRAGVSDVVLEFAWDTEMSEAAQDTLEKIDLVFLPPEAERPLILRYDPSLDPVMELSLSGSGDRFAGEEGLRRLRRLGDREIKRALEPIKGVAAVRVRGGLEEQIEIRLDEEKLRRSGLAAQMVATRLAQENVNVAGGTLKEGRTEYMVRTVNEYEGLGQIRETVVATLEGRQVRVGDLGEVAWAHEEQQMLTRTDGRLSVQIDLFKEGDANIVDLADRVKARLGELDLEAEARRAAGQAPPPKRPRFGPPGAEEQIGLATQLYRSEGVVLKVVADRSVFIRQSLDEVKSSAVTGGWLAVLVLLFFLRNVWSTLIVAISIPISLFITFAPLDLAGLTLNIMSLGGLALGIGMLVDNSIVVLESIFRCREEGDDVATAAVRGTAEVKSAVISSTLTTVAVFFPMVFVEGIAGEAFADLGLAVVASLLASLVVAIYLVPMLASRRFGAKPESAEAQATAAAMASEASQGFSPRRELSAFWARARAPLPQGWIKLPALLGRVLVVVGGPLYLLARWLVLAVMGLLLGLVLGVVRLGLGLFRVLRAVLGWFGRRWNSLGREAEVSPEVGESSALALLRARYEGVVRGAVRRPGLVVAVTVLMLVATAWMGGRLGSELLPEVHQGEISLEVTLPVGTPLEASDATLAPIEQAILAEHEHIRALILTVGFDPETSQRSDEGEHTARFKVLLESSNPRVEEVVVARLRDSLRSVPDAAARISRPVLFSFKTPIEVEIYGDDLARLKRSADAARERLAALPELADVEASLKRGAPEVQIVYDREMLARYGLNLRQVATLIRDQVKGAEATRFNLKDRRIPVLVRLGEADRETVADVAELVVNPGGERPVALSAVAAVTLGEGPSEVRRIDARRAAVIGANLNSSSGASLAEAVAKIETALDSLDWPADQTFVVSGQSAEWRKSQASLLLALGLSLFLVYVIMAAQFESLLHPLVIMVSIPLAFFGSALALYLTGTPISIVVFLGAILLGGVVVNNAIVLIDYVNLLRSRGIKREEALVTAGTVRLRPILMTTLTTVLGLLPMAFGLGDGAEIRRPLAITVIGGLSMSTLLTLVVIPSMYGLAEDLKTRLLGLRRRAQADSRPAAELMVSEPAP